MKKHILTFLIFICLVVVLVISLPKENKIKKYETEKIELAIYINDEETNTIPSKDSGYYYDWEKSSCTNGADINWDSISWSPVVRNMSEYKTRCELHFTTTYTEGILNGTDPVLEEPLIPVTIESDGTVKRADLTVEWYSYANKEWANAVILIDESQNSNYLIGDVIPESAIESYFVWIPKYRYQLWDLGNYDSLTSVNASKIHEIPIIFGDYNTSDTIEGECTTPMESGATGNCSVGDYMTHPAFLSIPSTGFWVGKFDTGYAGATTPQEAEQNVTDANKILIKPNIYIWNKVQQVNAFYTSYDYKRELDSHMMKNTEWGAVAYLQHSAYGSATSVRINNNYDLLSGYAGNDEPTCGYTMSNIECNISCNDGTCNTAYPNSVLASTTGNITGIYDMAGGAWEYVMGVMVDQSGNPMSGENNLYNSGFNGTFGCPSCDNGSPEILSLTTGRTFPDSKYYDKYLFDTAQDTNYHIRILGDATGEMGSFGVATYISLQRVINSWYADSASSISNKYPWVSRGYSYNVGSDAGMFAFSIDYGHNNNMSGFRLILTPTK